MEREKMASSVSLSAGAGISDDSDAEQVQAAGEQRRAAAPESLLLGRVLAHQVRVGGGRLVCPVGACGVLLTTLTISLSVSVWGAGIAYNIGDDATPDIDGFVPRGTEIGNRDNTFSLLLSGCAKTGLTNQPGSVCCQAAVDEDACVQLDSSLCDWDSDGDECKPAADGCGDATDGGDGDGSTATTATITGGGPGGTYAPADAAAGDSGRAAGAGGADRPEVARVLPTVELFCDECDRSVQVVYTPRDGSKNMLTADLIHSMCDYEARFQVAGHCQRYGVGSAMSAALSPGIGGCCGARTIGTALAHAVGKGVSGCQALTDEDISTALQLVLDCKETCVDDPTGWLSSLPITGVDCDTVLGLPAVKCSTDLSDYPLIASRFTVPAGMLVSELCPASCSVCTPRPLGPECDPVRQPVGHFKSVVDAVLGTDSAHTDGFTDVSFGVDGSLESAFLRSWMCYVSTQAILTKI
jgi:hypothetical protein